MRVGVVIPARDEAEALPRVLARLPPPARGDAVRVVVCDNGSRDGTAEAARRLGAEVVGEPRRGYGAACLRAVAHLGSWPDALVFLDADGSSRPEEIGDVLAPIRRGDADFVLGFRAPLLRAAVSMTPPQRWGTALAVALVRRRWGARFRDMGPLRAIRRDALERLGMDDRTWGWTLQMQILAVRRGFRWMEVPVHWDPRIAGRSKISGTASGVLRAGVRILWTVARHALQNDRRARSAEMIVLREEPPWADA